MSERVGKAVLIYAERPQQCDYCGNIKELRPYGPNGECICFSCAMKDEETTKRMMDKVLFGENDTIHFLVSGNSNMYYRACDSFCCWVGKKSNTVSPKNVTCKNCQRTKIYKQALSKAEAKDE